MSVERNYYFPLMQLRTNCKNLVVAGTLLIWTVKFFIRPFLQPTGTAGFLADIAPNLFGSFLIPFGAYWLYTHPHFFNGRLLRFSFFSDPRIVCLFGFGLLVVNEYLQLIPVFGRTFDYYDIVSSAIGLLSSCYSFSILQRRQAALL